MGTLVKRHLARQWGLDPGRLYHCAVMPCYDKKLEASREDFNLPGMRPLTCLLCYLLLACTAEPSYRP
jgi:iron only hydrogenase large subunit-like protein